MEMTIKQLANALGVCKQTVNNAILQLNLQDTLHKVGNKYLLSETLTRMKIMKKKHRKQQHFLKNRLKRPKRQNRLMKKKNRLFLFWNCRMKF